MPMLACLRNEARRAGSMSGGGGRLMQHALSPASAAIAALTCLHVAAICSSRPLLPAPRMCTLQQQAQPARP